MIDNRTASSRRRARVARNLTLPTVAIRHTVGKYRG